MTSCIAWNEQGRLYFAADSRISLGAAPPIDACAKIVRLPINVRILGTENDRLDFAVGLAFAGSFITANTVQQILLELLPLAQVAPERVKISLPLFVNIIKQVFEDVTRQVCGSMFDAGMAELLVSRYCPDSNTLRLFHIESSKVDGSLIFTTNELSLSEPAFIGSAAGVARALAHNRPLYELPSVLRTIIHDESVPGVGGPIQFGRAESENFRSLVFKTTRFLTVSLPRTTSIAA